MPIVAGDIVYNIRGDSKQLIASLASAKAGLAELAPAARTAGIAMGVAGGAIVASLGMAAKTAADFQGTMAKSATLGVKDMGTLSTGVRDVAKTFGVDLTNAAQASYQAISAGAKEAEVPQLLATSAKAAVAGFTDLTSAVELGMSVTNAYGKEVADVGVIFDQALTAQNLGVTTIAEMNESVGKLIPSFASAGLGSDQLFASIAALTKGGIRTTESITYLNAVVTAFQRQGEDAKLKTMGLQGALDWLKESTGGNTEEMLKFLGSTEALKAVLALTGAQAGSFSEALAAMGSSTGAVDAAFKILEENDPSRVWAKLRAEMVDVAVEVGGHLLPVLGELMAMMLPVIKAVGEWAGNHPKLTAAITLTVAAIGALMLALSPLLIAFSVLAPMLSALSGIGGFAGVTAAATTATTAMGGIVAAAGATLLAIAPLIAIVVAATAAIYAIGSAAMAWGKASEQLHESQRQLVKQTDTYLAQLDEMDVKVNKIAASAMDHADKMKYLADTEKAAADTAARAWFEHYAGRVESQEEFARMRALMLNEEIDAQEAAFIVQQNLSIEQEKALIMSMGTRTNAMLDSLGITTQMAMDADVAVAESGIDAARAREEAWINANHAIAEAEAQALASATSTWEGFKSWLDDFIGSGLANWRPFGTDENSEGKASGGRIEAGNKYTIGEQGPELFVPDKANKSPRIIAPYGIQKDVPALLSGMIYTNQQLRSIAQLIPGRGQTFNRTWQAQELANITDNDTRSIKKILESSGSLDSQMRQFGMRALGGPVSAGQPYLVGEKGPELIVPRQPGQVMTASQTASIASGGGGGINISGPLVQVDRVDATDAADVNNLATRMGEELQRLMQGGGRQMSVGIA